MLSQTIQHIASSLSGLPSERRQVSAICSAERRSHDRAPHAATGAGHHRGHPNRPDSGTKHDMVGVLRARARCRARQANATGVSPRLEQ